MASASIFTYETDIPRVSSPWLRQPEATKSGQGSGAPNADHVANETSGTLKQQGRVTRLEAEPQDGPVEYKLHLLLRPRRSFTSISTVSRTRGSTRSHNAKFTGLHSSRSVSETSMPVGTTPVSTQQSRQHRLEQLTTQLLWRLQQSSPHHASSATNVVLPAFPEALPELEAPGQLAKLPHGLEESQGALYEIGVSDDGTFVGLAEDEMRESLNNLRAMAACLGCIVEVQRMVKVGQCNWIEENPAGKYVQPIQHTGNLVVAEALVKPHLDHNATVLDIRQTGSSTNFQSLESHPTTQLRVSFTGATMSGKSSLLGALSTTTLDNGRGQSRLSMLKHRHEITSGITSSITQELIGYSNSVRGDIEVINYATEGISSWIDMHAAAHGGRLVFASDSAGHPRYRRTTVRGLVGWSPHWAILCIPADDEGDSSGRIGSTPSSSDMLGPAASNVDLSAAHLDLCLRLGLPLVVAVTKYDLASKTGLRLTLAKLLSIIKTARRLPILLPVLSGVVAEQDLQTVSQKKLAAVQEKIQPLFSDPTRFVPIILTSAVQGAGLDTLHALLHELPVPSDDKDPMIGKAEPVNSAFYIEDVYNKTLDTKAVVVSGHLRRGAISVGDKVILGPCSGTVDDSDDSDGQRRPSLSTGLTTSRSFPGALRGKSSLLARSKLAEQEWRHVRIVSIRNLRLPVNTLHANQVGTIGLQLADSDDLNILATLKIRKGMVLSDEPIKSTRTVVAQFRRADLGSLAVGSQVVLYIASIRAAARILSARTPEPDEIGNGAVWLEEVDVPSQRFDDPVDEMIGSTAGAITDHFLMVTLHFESVKEYVEVDSKVLVMPGGGPGLFGGTERGEKGAAGLEGFVGTVTEVYE